MAGICLPAPADGRPSTTAPTPPAPGLGAGEAIWSVTGGCGCSHAAEGKEQDSPVGASTVSGTQIPQVGCGCRLERGAQSADAAVAGPGSATSGRSRPVRPATALCPARDGSARRATCCSACTPMTPPTCDRYAAAVGPQWAVSRSRLPHVTRTAPPRARRTGPPPSAGPCRSRNRRLRRERNPGPRPSAAGVSSRSRRGPWAWSKCGSPAAFVQMLGWAQRALA
jgi:hypothetical protein